MMTLFFSLCAGLILAELVKGLSANGTPPVLQSFSWQMDLAYFMWSYIVMIRIVLLVSLVAVASQLSIESPGIFGITLICCVAMGGGM